MGRAGSTPESPAALRAAEPLTTKTQLPSRAPTGSTATAWAPVLSRSTRREAFASPGMRLVHTSGRTTCRMSISALPVPVVDDSDDGEIARILLAAGGLAGGGAAHADHPIARHAADRVHRNLLGLPVVHHQQVLVFEPRDAVSRDQRLFDLADFHR